MRDLFSVQKEVKGEENKLEMLMKQILQLQTQVSKIVKEQKKDKEIILQNQKNLEEKIKLQKNNSLENKNTNFTEEENYILLEEPEEVNMPTIKEEYIGSLEREIVKSVVKNKKTIIKQKILAISSKQRTTSKKVKEIIVDKYRYCSKATFYRYLSELKRHQKIETISVNNKEYICNLNINKKNTVF
jgi:hypothetical protein